MSDLQWDRNFALEQTADDEELLEELLDLFRDASKGDFQQLKRAVAAGDTSGVISAAHSLKGASASLGIEGVRQLATAMESGAREGSVEVAKDKLDAMANLLEQVNSL